MARGHTDYIRTTYAQEGNLFPVGAITEDGSNYTSTSWTGGYDEMRDFDPTTSRTFQGNTTNGLDTTYTLTFDFHHIRSWNSVRLDARCEVDSPTNTTMQIELQTSDDNSTYTTQADTSTFTPNADKTLTFGGVNSRYVRLKLSTNVTDTVQRTWKLFVYEFSFNGT